MPELAHLAELLGAYTSDRRLYDLEGEGPLSELLVEQFSLFEELNMPWHCRLVAVSLNAALDIHAMSGKRVDLLITLPEGGRRRISGIVTQVQRDAGDGSWGRYVLTVRAALGLLTYARASRFFQDKRLTDIIETVLAEHPQLAWRWAADIGEHLARSPFSNPDGLRSSTTQFNETDAEFIHRLLAEEGIVYYFEPDEAAPCGQTVVFVADTTNADSCPQDPASRDHGGIRFHRDDPTEPRDTIQTLGAARSLTSSGTTLLSWDYKAKRAVSSSISGTLNGTAAGELAGLELYDTPGAYAFANQERAQRAALIVQQSIEARQKRWFGRSTVRSLATGHTIRIIDSPLDHQPDADAASDAESAERNRDFLLTRLVHHGINNLPREIGERLAERKSRLLEPVPEWVAPELRAQAAKSGYANQFEASRRYVPWRRALTDAHGAKLNLKPSAPGPMEATVCDAAGNTAASGADELHMDRLGRIRVQFDFQTLQRGAGLSTSSTWVRVAQRYAGAGMGLQTIPRIGQRVLVDFINADIDRPLVVAALYGGKGEGGVPATPGGAAAQTSAQTDRGVFARSRDDQPAGQGNLTGGHSPAWHGASPQALDADGQRNASALSGFKSKEFGGEGFNQTVFDDSDGQLRVQAGTTQWATWLNLGHLIHQADNHRGSFRGLGWELRTDAYGAIRADRGVLLSTYGTSLSEPAGDNAPGIALVAQIKALSKAFWAASKTHQTVQPSGWLGTFRADQSALSAQEPGFAALHTVVKGMVDRQDLDAARADAQSKNTRAGSGASGKLPHSTDAIVALAGKAGIVQIAGQDVQFAAGENISIGAGMDINQAIGGASRLHTGQAIGILGGAIGPGGEAAGTGVTVIAGKGDVEVQAQSDQIQIASKERLQVQSKLDAVTLAAAKRIVIATGGGASITIEGGNITLACPGTITVRAASRSFVGPERVDYPLPEFPDATLSPIKRKASFTLGALPGVMSGYAGEPFKLYADGGLLLQGPVDDSGQVMWEHKEGTQQYKIALTTGQVFEVAALDAFKDGAERRANDGYRGFEHTAAQKSAHGAQDDEFRRRVQRGKNLPA